MSATKAEKVLILGLDCADPKLMFENFIDDLPNFRSLMEQGTFGEMRSTIPPITVPAWSCMASSKEPGQLGFYGFRNRADHSYDKLTIATSLAVKEPRLWDILGARGKKSFVFGVPQTFPVRPINGWMISSFLTPSTDSAFTHPASLKAEIEEKVGEYMIDVRNFRTSDKHWLLEEANKLGKQHYDLAVDFIEKYDWDMFWMVDMVPDRLHHGFWQYMDPKHHRYEPGNEFENAIRDYYIFADGQLGRMLEKIDRDRTAVWVVSDHGAKCMTGGLCFNDWLIEQGYLTLKSKPTKPTRFGDVEIDWSKTKAWGEGGYYGRCFFNVEGREPNGQIPQAEYEAFARELTEKLETMVDHQGKPMGTKVYRPKDTYRKVNGVAPDLMVLFGNLDWRSVGSVGNESIYTFENDTGPDDANHNIDGLFICSGAGAPRRGRDKISIYDMAPTVLSQLGMQVPGDMVGKSVL